ncbi:hypothetical protein [Hyphomonas sp.]|uniref:hypothetical protein n=1 Tax=Hyphomonas sp. TaxID=87 RepID=UPI003001040D
MAEIKTPDISLTGVGNVLFGLAAAFLVDNIALDGVVTSALPDVVVGFVGFVIFAGVALYGYKQAKKLN